MKSFNIQPGENNKSPEQIKKESREKANKEIIKEYLGEVFKILVETQDRPNLFLTREQRKIFEKKIKGQEISDQEKSSIVGYDTSDYENYEKNIYRGNIFTRGILAISIIERAGGLKDEKGRDINDLRGAIVKELKLRRDVSKFLETTKEEDTELKNISLESFLNESQKILSPEDKKRLSAEITKILPQEVEALKNISLEAIKKILSPEDKKRLSAEITKILPQEVEALKNILQDTLVETIKLLSPEEKKQFIGEISNKHYDDPEKQKKQQYLIQKLTNI